MLEVPLFDLLGIVSISTVSLFQPQVPRLIRSAVVGC